MKQQTQNLPTPTRQAAGGNGAVAIRQPSDSYVSRYLDEVAPTSVAGRLVKFSKNGEFACIDDGAVLGEDDIYTALCDETWVGWVKFSGAGEAPERVGGILYDPKFCMPDRQALGDLDTSKWEMGLDGKPADPWLHQMNLVLQSTSSGELYTFSTTSATGRRAVGVLLKTYERYRAKGDLPLIELKVSGFEHKDSRVGWVKTPAFVVVGRTPRDDAPRSTPTTGELMDDIIPF